MAKVPYEPITALYFPPKKKGVLASMRRLAQGDIKGKKAGRVSKLGRKMHCNKCHDEGHNMKTCTARVNKLKVTHSLSFDMFLTF